MKVAILGAGIIGTTSAWYLARAGHEVVVLDRQPQVALETSFANGGQISVSHSEPWANPLAPIQILQWLGRVDAPLRFTPHADLRQWEWAARFLFECLPMRTRKNTLAAFSLARYSQSCLHELVRETGIEYERNTKGILHFFTGRRLLKHARRETVILQEKGFPAAFKTPEECIAVEPALTDSRSMLKGGILAASDESGDAHRFSLELSERARALGVAFRLKVCVKRLEADAGRIARVVIDDEYGIEESVRADAYVVALGSYSPLFLRPLGVDLPIYPVKGYSITVPLGPEDVAPRMSLTDHERKVVFTRLGDRLRVAGTAEMNGYSTEIDEGRCEALITRTCQLFPRAGLAASAQLWTGLRPATPSNLPLIGVTRYPGLFLNTGHGTLGWTLACGSGCALADIVSGRTPQPEFPFLRH